jgi:hypothetical protein
MSKQRNPFLSSPQREKSTVSRDVFLLEEYKALRQEILLKLQHAVDIQKYTMIAVAVIYTAAFTLDGIGISDSAKTIANLIWYLPPVIVLTGMIFYGIYDFVVQSIGIYIREIERHFLRDTKPQGWERHFGREQQNPLIGRGAGINKLFIGVVFSPFWLFGLLLTVAIAFAQKSPSLKDWVELYIP